MKKQIESSGRYAIGNFHVANDSVSNGICRKIMKMPGDDSKSTLYEGYIQSGEKYCYGREIFPNGEYCEGQYRENGKKFFG